MGLGQILGFIFEENRELLDFERLYNDWSSPIDTDEDFTLFERFVRSEMGAVDVRGLVAKAEILGIVPIKEQRLNEVEEEGVEGEEEVVGEEEEVTEDGVEGEAEFSGDEIVPESDLEVDSLSRETSSEVIPDEAESKEQGKVKQLPETEPIGVRQGYEYELVRVTNDSGDIVDVVVQDQTEEQVWSAKEAGVDFTDMRALVREIDSELSLEVISSQILTNYGFFDPIEPEEDVEDVDTGIPPVESNPGDVGGPPLETVVDEGVIEESDGLEKVLSGSGVVDRWWWMPGKDLVVAGINDDQATAIASQLNGEVAGTLIQDGRKCYRIIFESSIVETNHSMKMAILNYINEHEVVKKNLGQISIDLKKNDPTYTSTKAFYEVLGLVEASAKRVFEVQGGVVGGKLSYPSETQLKNLATEIMYYLHECRAVNEDYEVLASNISDEEVAKSVATSKQGQVIKDPEDEKKFIVIKQKI